MALTLTHPKTGRSVTVSEKEADFYTDNGWESAPATKSKKEPADGTEGGAGKPAARKAAKAD